jgi:hypothetical protein
MVFFFFFFLFLGYEVLLDSIVVFGMTEQCVFFGNVSVSRRSAALSSARWSRGWSGCCGQRLGRGGQWLGEAFLRRSKSYVSALFSFAVI